MTYSHTTTLTFLGTASVTPEPDNDTASLLVGGTVLVDPGWYAMLRMRRFGYEPTDLRYVLVSHCHHDHYLGLAHVLFYLRMEKGRRPDRPPIKVVGPAADVERVVALARQYLQCERFPDVETQPEVIPLEPGASLSTEGFQLDTFPVVHAVQAMCVRLTDRRTGVRLAYTGDTAYHPPLADFVRGVDLLVHEASMGDRATAPGESFGHSGAPDAARIAAAAQVRRLALVHMHHHLRDPALRAASAVFPNTFVPQPGTTIHLRPAPSA